MGRYISASNIYDVRIYGLSATVIPSTTVDIFIDDTEAIINSYISKQYTLPLVPTSLTNVPPILAKLNKDLAAYEILNYLYSQQNQNVNNWVKDLGTSTYAMLESIANDDTRIIYALGSLAAMNNDINMGSTLEGFPLMFNVDDDADMHVPGQLLDQISENRLAAD